MGDPKTAAALAQKAEQWHQLVGALHQRRSQSPSQETATSTLALLEKALLVNPDPLNLWNHRRECITYLHDNPKEKEPEATSTDDDSESKTLEAMLTPELKLTQASLQRNPKAYGAWMHRKWILQYLKAPKPSLEQELELTVLFLKLDERNFHCWNYRRFVIGALSDAATPESEASNSYTGRWKGPPPMGVQVVAPSATATTAPNSRISDALIQAEWEFTTKKIEDNFSNFSAFHYRSQLLGRMLELEQVQWEDELELLENAIATEPDDQTAWWYQALLLDHPLVQAQLKEDSAKQSRLQDDHLALLDDLLEDDPESKWILLGIHRVLDTLHINTDRQRQVLTTLQTVDADRAQRYQELMDAIREE